MSFPDKKVVTSLTLSLQHSALIHLDPRLEGVVVPPWLKHQAQLVLEFGKDLIITIPDLLLTEEGISGTLSFARTPYKCFVPWKSVFAVVGNDDGRGCVWEDSIPSEVVKEMELVKSKKIESKVTAAAGRQPRTKSGKLLPIGWRIIEGGSGGSAA